MFHPPTPSLPPSTSGIGQVNGRFRGIPQTFNSVRRILLNKMARHKLLDMVVLGLCVSGFLSHVSASDSPPEDRCPADYRYRVETCVMEAQVAPQAGGGLPLITERNKLEELCSRGILQKTIDCLRDIFTRCAGNATRRHELDMLFSVEDWRRGRALLCEDLSRKLVFKDHFDCVSQFVPTISRCILTKTMLFRRDVAGDGIVAHKTLHEITCNFAENIVMCLERPLARACSLTVVETMTSALHRFLPPACAPVPAVYDSDGPLSQTPQGGQLLDLLRQPSDDIASPEEQDGAELGQSQQEPMHLETIIVEGGEAEN